MSKELLRQAFQNLKDSVGEQITGYAYLTRGDGTGTLIADQTNRLAFYWQAAADGTPIPGTAILHPRSGIIFKNSIDYETVYVKLGKIQDDNTIYILGEQLGGGNNSGGATSLEQEIKAAGQSKLPIAVTADQNQPSLVVYIEAHTFDVGGTIYHFPKTAVDLSASLPGSANKMCFAGIFIQNDYATIEIQTSTPRLITDLPLGLADVQEIVTAATSTDAPVFAVKLVNGQATISQDDLNNDGWPLQQYVSLSNAGASLTVEDGTTTITNVTKVKFTSGATVTNTGGGEADVAISGGGTTVAARAHTVAGQSIAGSYAGTVINFDVVDFDTGSDITTGASWKFTASVAGYYRVSVAAYSNWNASDDDYLHLAKNGTTWAVLEYFGTSFTNNAQKFLKGTSTVYLGIGDYIQIVMYNCCGGTSLKTDANSTYVDIELVAQ